MESSVSGLQDFPKCPTPRWKSGMASMRVSYLSLNFVHHISYKICISLRRWKTPQWWGSVLYFQTGMKKETSKVLQISKMKAKKTLLWWAHPPAPPLRRFMLLLLVRSTSNDDTKQDTRWQITLLVKFKDNMWAHFVNNKGMYFVFIIITTSDGWLSASYYFFKIKNE